MKQHAAILLNMALWKSNILSNTDKLAYYIYMYLQPEINFVKFLMYKNVLFRNFPCY